MFNQLKMMRMKKIFAFGLILLVLAFVQAMVLKTAPIDDDVGICYVDNMDMIHTDIAIDNTNPVCFSDYEVYMFADAGPPLCRNMETTYPENINQYQNLYNTFETRQYEPVYIEGLSCLNIGDRYSPDRILSRHS